MGCSLRSARITVRWARSISSRCRARIRYDVMDLKSLQDWVIVKQLKSVPNVVDFRSFGGTTREYQVHVDPNKLISYGLDHRAGGAALANNNVNAGGSFIEAGRRQINVRAVGLVTNVTTTSATRC